MHLHQIQAEDKKKKAEKSSCFLLHASVQFLSMEKKTEQREKLSVKQVLWNTRGKKKQTYM